MVDVFREVRRVLRDDGTVWLNLGDSYAGGGRAGNNPEYMGKHKMFGKDGWDAGIFGRPQPIPYGLKPKDLIGIPWRVAFALQADGWYLRQDIIWHKPNPMPESVRDRCTKSHEYVFLLSKSARYYYDIDALREPVIPDPRDACWGTTAVTSRHGHEHDAERGMMQGRTQAEGFVRMSNPLGKNKRSVWTVSTAPYSAAHFATYPPALIEPCILAGSRPGDTVLDPFGGSGTTAAVALEHGRKAILIELSEKYAALVPDRIRSITDAIDQMRLFDDPKPEPIQLDFAEEA
jgi:site-specific DNA-methyltransferase (adenine-specific)